MNFDKERLLVMLRPNVLPIAIGSLGTILILAGIISIFLSNKNEGVIFESEGATSSANLRQQIMVDVSGAVVRPGVYSLTSEARIKDALIAAGGLSDLADRDWVTKKLNLANKLTDGVKIYIPEKGTTGGTGTTSTTGSSPRDTLININTASLSELDKLPGIGPVTAQKIIDNRPYGTVDELRQKKAVSEKIFNQIKDSISVY